MVKVNVRRRDDGKEYSSQTVEISRVPCADEYYADPETRLWYQVDIVVHTPGDTHEAIVYLLRHAVKEAQIADRERPAIRYMY